MTKIIHRNKTPTFKCCSIGQDGIQKAKRSNGRRLLRVTVIRRLRNNEIYTNRDKTKERYATKGNSYIG